MDLVEKMRDAIQQSGLTHYAIGKEAGIDPSVLDRFVSGERDIQLGTAAKITNVLGLALSSVKKPGRKRAAGK